MEFSAGVCTLEPSVFLLSAFLSSRISMLEVPLNAAPSSITRVFVVTLPTTRPVLVSSIFSWAIRLPYTIPATRISTADISPFTVPLSPTIIERSDKTFPTKVPSILADSEAVRIPSILVLLPIMVLIILVLMVVLSFFFKPNMIISPLYTNHESKAHIKMLPRL